VVSRRQSRVPAAVVAAMTTPYLIWNVEAEAE
jgi:hypothetical protein